MDAKQLCLALMGAESDAEVVQLLQAAGYWDDPSAWRPVGDNENNFSIIGAQQSDPIAALIEKIVNSIDARLVNACYRAGMAPDGIGAPASIREAVARFFESKEPPIGDRDGKVAHWEDKDLTREGRELTVSASGFAPEQGSPSISIADGGEGQAPDDFPTTFMSLNKSNKLRIPFVQGKFNMGGTGALQFSSQPNNLQLVVSRRNPALISAGSPDRVSHWGFTVVRREEPTDNRRSSVYTYLAPVDADAGLGSVLSFPSETLPIFPEADSSIRSACARDAEYGSLVKLYEYTWTSGSKSNIVQSGGGLLRKIETGLPEVALPVRLFECRPNYSGGPASFATNALGLITRLDRDRADNLEAESPVAGDIFLDGTRLPIRVYVFKKGKARDYRGRFGVVYSINGQTHATATVDFYRRNDVKMGYLADSLLTVVDCSAISGKAREDLFMNSRDRLRNNVLSDHLEVEVERFLKSDPTLREIQNRRRQEQLSEKLADQKPLADVLQSLVKATPLLARFFQFGARIPAPFPEAGGGAGTQGDFVGRPDPTYFRFLGGRNDVARSANLGSRARVMFETDASNDYFSRESYPATLAATLELETGEAVLVNGTRGNLHDGSMSYTFELPEGAAVGLKFRIEFAVSDGTRTEPFLNSASFTVEPPAKPRPGGGSGQRTNPNSGTGSQGSAGRLALPNITEVTRDKWSEHEFDEYSALRIVSVPGGPDGAAVFDFFVNVDNRHLKAAQKETRTDPRLLEKRFVYGQVLVGLAVIQEHRDQEAQRAQSEIDWPSVEAIVSDLGRALGPVLLPMLDGLGGISVDDLPDEDATA